MVPSEFVFLVPKASILVSQSTICIKSQMEAALAVGLANCVLEKLGEIAAEKAWDEASLLLNFKTDFKWLEKKLRQICFSLQAADEHSGQNKDVREWLAEVRNIAFDAEDIIDECAAEHLYTNTSQSCVCNFSELGFRYKMGKRIKKIKKRIRDSIQQAQELKLFHDVSHLNQPSTSTSHSEREADSSRWDIFQRDDPAVAIDHKVDEILALLENPSVGVVAVMGMVGLGKTFLLRHVYDRTKHRYESSAWLSVSQTYSLRSLQCDMAFQMNFQIDATISDRLAAEFIHGKLEGKRCLIVLDDLWCTSVEGSLISRLRLPTGRNNQCKILVTTRSRDVAENVNEMQHLTKDESWNLFCLFAFPDREGNSPPEKLESLAHQIVEECGRLPLAIKTIAASMTKSSLISHWESKVEQLKKIGKTEDSITKILKLSYDSLSPSLKSYFSYLSFFPEDTYISFSTFKFRKAIHQEYVVHLWMAGGCIPQGKRREQLDIGLGYLHELENLCLLEVDKIRSCYTVHDLFLDLAVNICKEYHCEFDLPLEETSCRRLLLAKKGLDTNVISERSLPTQQFLLRSLSFSQNTGITNIPKELLEHARLLRVIDFSHTAISTLPKCVGNLKLLKVLNLSYTEIREVPDCVRRLKNLQFLDVSDCTRLQRVPDWIGELKSLSYLDVQRCSGELSRSRMPKGISQLSSLRTLRSVCFPLDIEDNEFLNIQDVGNLTSLREIHFCLRDVGTLRSVDDGILDRLVKLRILAVENGLHAREGSTGESSLAEFPQKVKVMKGLQQLYIGRFSVPGWICGMENLTDLSLWKCTNYPSLQKMPNLQLLALKNDSKCRELPNEFGESGGFPKLAKLQIINFPLLKQLPTLEEGAMQRLQILFIEKCPQVGRVPEGLEQLRRLKRIEVHKEAHGEFKKRLNEGGEDWRKISAKNPYIEITIR